MSTVSQERVTPRRRRLHAALGTAAITVTAVATIAVGARTLGVAPPPGDISTFCAGAGQCVQHLSVGSDLGAPLTYR